jgi:hypothetical protein
MCHGVRSSCVCCPAVRARNDAATNRQMIIHLAQLAKIGRESVEDGDRKSAQYQFGWIGCTTNQLDDIDAWFYIKSG